MLKRILNFWVFNSLFLAILTTFIILVLSLINLNRLPFETFNQSDKLEHFIAYFVLMLVWLTALHQQKIKLNKLQLFVLLVLFGIIIEVLQSVLTDYRTLDVFDVLANTIGLSLGFISYKYIRFQLKKLLKTNFTKK